MNIIAFGEVLMRLSPPGYTRFGQATSFDLFFAGAEYNTSISLSRMGQPISFVTRLPDNDLGMAAIEQLNRYRVDTRHIVLGGKRLGIYFLEQGAMARGSKVIYDREHSSLADIESGAVSWTAVFKEAGWFHCTGITAALSKAAAQELLRAVKAAFEAGLTVSIDLNFRSKLWQYGQHPSEIMPEIFKYCHVVLGDMDTVKTYFNISVGDTEQAGSYEQVMRTLKMAFPQLTDIIFSYRKIITANHNAIGACYLKGDIFLQSKEYDLNGIVDRLGGGDALMAGIIYGIIHYPDSPQQSIDYALAAAALKSTIPGDTNFVSAEEVKGVMSGQSIGRINR